MVDFSITRSLTANLTALIRTFNGVGDGSTDDTSAFIDAISDDNRPIVIIPEPSVSYVIDGEVVANAGVMSSGKRLIGVGNRPTLKLKNNSDAHLLGLYSVSDIQMHNLTFDGNDANNSTGACLVLSNVTDFVGTDLTFINAAAQGIVGLSGSHRVNFLRTVLQDCAAHGAEIGACYDFNFDTVNISGNGGFGILYEDVSYDCSVSRLRSVDNALEAMIVKWDSYRCHLYDAIATGSGDNGFSFDGEHNTARLIRAYNNANNGFGIYGNYNEVSGQFWNNGQSGSGFAGVALVSGFGGRGSKNRVEVLCFDNQSGAETQDYGVYISDNAYNQWSSGGSYNTSNPFFYYGNNVYRVTDATNNGTLGTTPPTHTTGTASDGLCDLIFLFTGDGSPDTLDPSGNVVHVMSENNAVAGLQNDSENTNTTTNVAL